MGKSDSAINLLLKKFFLISLFFSYNLQAVNDKIKLDSEINLIDFGAKGDGSTDDSNAFVKAIDYAAKNKLSILNLSGNYIFNLNSKKIQLPKRIALKFSGSILKNAELVGVNSLIIADPVKIFDNINLSGNYINTKNIYVEWFGTFPNDASSTDLSISLEKLNKVFFSIYLNKGIYYTKIGNIDLKGIEGLSPNLTFIEFDSPRNNAHLFHIGKVGGTVSERSYENNFLKSVSLVLISKDRKISNNSLLVIGACHQAKIDDVKFIANSNNTSLTSSELLSISKDNNAKLANAAIEFNGASELISFNNIFTLSDVGILFSKGTDFVNISNYTSWNGNNGLATVYFEDPAVSNIIFSGNQSWSQGLYGIYAKNGTAYSNFVNVKFENVRIEQLNTNIKKENKIVATSLWFGDYTYVPNLILNNIMLAGTANGIKFGKIQDGNIKLNDILVFNDFKVSKKFAIEAKFKEKGNLELYLNNVNLASDAPVSFENSNYNDGISRNNHFKNEVISNK